MTAQNIIPQTTPLAKQIVAPLPGLALVAALAAGAIWAKGQFSIPLLGPMVIAMGLGVVLRNVFGALPWAAQGIFQAQRPLMRLGIVLLGLQLSLSQIIEAGAPLFLGIAALLAASYSSTQLFGRWLGVAPELTRLIGAGTAVCGASAVMAVQGARPGSHNDLAYAIACVTLFGTLSMIGLPVLALALGLDGQGLGLWAGAAIHEVAQVVGATDSHSVEAAEWGMMAKLTRVLLLAPLVLVLTRFGGPSEASDGPSPLPLFVLGFAAMMGLNSAVALPAEVLQPAATLTSFLLTMALAAMGLNTDLAALKRKGLRPLALGAIATLFVTAGALALLLLI